MTAQSNSSEDQGQQANNWGPMAQYLIKEFAKRDPEIANLNQEQLESFMPKLMSHAQYRVGQELIPELDEESAQEFADLQKQEGEVSAERWQQFWEKNVENYEEKVQAALDNFIDECEGLLDQQEEKYGE